MAVEVTIHSISIENLECVISVNDNNTLIVDQNNIGLQLDSNGNADMDWIRNKVKRIVSEFRLKDQPPLVIHTTGE